MLRSLVLITLAASLSGCCKPPKAGDACKTDNEERCVDATNALVCHAKKYEPMKCEGPKGCIKQGTESDCDESVGSEGARCNVDGKSSCSVDHKAMLLCTANQWKVASNCRGPEACKINGTTITCDASLSQAGDPCEATNEGKSVCQIDGKAMLACKGGSFQITNQCLGAKGCRVDGTKIRCDMSIGKAGDACSHTGHACSTDGKFVLECKGGKLVVDKDCKSKKCVVDPNDETLSCK